jgi:hypothetical protein
MKNKYYKIWIDSFLSYYDFITLNNNLPIRQKKEATSYIDKAKNYYKIANNRLIKSKNENN